MCVLLSVIITFSCSFFLLPFFLSFDQPTKYNTVCSASTTLSKVLDTAQWFLLLLLSSLVLSSLSLSLSACLQLLCLLWLRLTLYMGDVESGAVAVSGMYSLSRSRSRSISRPAAARSPCSDISRSRSRFISRWQVCKGIKNKVS